MARDEIIKALKEITGLSEKDIVLESPDNEEFGDYSSNVALKDKNPKENSKKIVEKLKKDKKLSDIVEKIEVAGAGFINFWLSKKFLLENLESVSSSNKKHRKVGTFGGKRVMFEYGDANTHKLPHIGHLFSYIYGESTTRVLEAAGAQLNRADYQGDIGLHVAKCLWAFKKNKPEVPKTLKEKVHLLQKMYQEGSSAFDENEETKEEIKKLNKGIYDQSPDIYDLWKKTRSWSIDYYKQFEERLGIKYDRYYFESEVYLKGREIVEKNVGKIFKKSQGAIIFEGSKYGLHDRVFVTKYQTPTYEAKDMYLQNLKRDEWPMDLLIITTAHEQNEYFKVVFKALELIDPTFEGKLKHIGFGMVNLKSGKMSSRTGEVIGAIELVEAAVASVYDFVKERNDLEDKEKKEISEVVGIGAVKYSFLKGDPLQNIKFDLKESISIQGNSGPYLQYTVARINSVLAKAKNKSAKVKLESDKQSLTLRDKLSKEEENLLRSLVKFPEVIELAANRYSPSVVCSYLYDLAQKFNLFYEKEKILGSENEGFRLGLTSAVGQVLKTGLNLLGIQTPKRM